MRTYLFIGGPADGQRIEVPEDQNSFRFMQRSSPIPSPEVREYRAEDVVVGQVVTYEKVAYHEGIEFFWIFRPAGDRQSIMQRLLENYHPGEAITGELRNSMGDAMAVEIGYQKVCELIESGCTTGTLIIQKPAALEP